MAFEDVPVARTNYARSLFDAAHPDSTTIRVSGDSDEDSSGVYFHDPFTVLFLHVEGVTDSVGIIVGVHGGITQRGTSIGFSDTAKFRFSADAVLDTIVTAGDYRYPITINQAQHIYFTFDAYTDNGASTTVIGDLVRRKYN